MTHILLVRTSQLKDGKISGELAELVDPIRVGETFDVRPLAWSEDTVSHGGGLVDLWSQESLSWSEVRDRLIQFEGACLLAMPDEPNEDFPNTVDGQIDAALASVGLVRK